MRTRSLIKRGIKDDSPVPQVLYKKRRTEKVESVLLITSPASCSVKENCNETTKKEGVQIEVEKTNSVHTSDVVERITNDCDKDVDTNLTFQYSTKEMLVGYLTAAKHQTLNSVDQLKQRSSEILKGWKNMAGEFIRSYIQTPDADDGLYHVSGVQKILASRPQVQVFEEIESEHSDHSSN
uniref:Swi5-dependent recombination DNA repair protein 1 homolog n=1 Tax=Strongyloides venezuelensis TaxID=75913 RepID=A0A0K0FR05_STRVS